ncbi:hypothetical protein R6Q59_016681 [Mikania micrantha]
MSEEIAGSTPSRSSPKKLKMESEEEATGLLKEEDHSEEEYKKLKMTLKMKMTMGQHHGGVTRLRY